LAVATGASAVIKDGEYGRSKCGHEYSPSLESRWGWSGCGWHAKCRLADWDHSI